VKPYIGWLRVHVTVRPTALSSTPNIGLERELVSGGIKPRALGLKPNIGWLRKA